MPAKEQAMVLSRKALLLTILLMLRSLSWAQQFEGDWTAPDFTFQSGEKLSQLRLHYITLGAPQRDASGHVLNAVLMLHGTGGTARSFLSAELGGELFGRQKTPGGPSRTMQH